MHLQGFAVKLRLRHAKARALAHVSCLRGISYNEMLLDCARGRVDGRFFPQKVSWKGLEAFLAITLSFWYADAF